MGSISSVFSICRLSSTILHPNARMIGSIALVPLTVYRLNSLKSTGDNKSAEYGHITVTFLTT